MKLLAGLNEELKGVRGMPVKLEADKERGTIKDALLFMTAQSKLGSAKQDLKALKIAWRLEETEVDSIELEDAELELLQEVVEKNGPNYPVMIRGALYGKLQEAKDNPKKEKNDGPSKGGTE